MRLLDAASLDQRTATAALETLASQWKDSYTAMIVELARLLRPAAMVVEQSSAAEFSGGFDDGPEGGGSRRLDELGGTVRRATRESLARTRLVQFLERRTGKRFDPQLRAWRAWMWTLPYEPHPDYAEFKGALYGRIDRRMSRFFPPGVTSIIWLDEVDWGGVPVNGIPPLYYPDVVPAAEAGYLRDGHVVFGLVVNGEARAYPKRILAWREMARERVGGVELHVVYCTLCGTVLPYESVAGNRTWRFGTSGLLYRSNKLMFDEETAACGRRSKAARWWGSWSIAGCSSSRGRSSRRREESGGDGTRTRPCSRSRPGTSATTPKARPTATTSRTTRCTSRCRTTTSGCATRPPE